jgi:hypothetical protein
MAIRFAFQIRGPVQPHKGALFNPFVDQSTCGADACPQFRQNAALAIDQFVTMGSKKARFSA